MNYKRITTNYTVMRVFFFLLLAVCLSSSLLAQDAASGLRFVANKGQWDGKVKYRADLPGGKLFAEQNSFTYLFYDTKYLSDRHGHAHSSGNTENNTRHPDRIESSSEMIKMHAFRMRPIDALNSATVTPIQQTSEVYNFYLGNDPSKWASGVKASKELLYKGIYENTDLRLYQSANSFKYEFIVYPGADPAKIKLQYEGLDKIYLREGDLVMETSVNSIIEKAPYVYQLIEGKEVKIKSRFKLRDSTVVFDLQQSYNKAYPLIIDPQLIFSTYSGSFADNWGNTAAYDEAGNMYSGGTVFGTGYPSTTGAFQVNYAGTTFSNGFYGIDVGILKFNPTGTGLIYCTYLGGFLTEAPYSLVVNSNDELVIMGSTSSANFPTTAGAFDNTFNGGTFVEPVSAIRYNNGSDIFVSRLSSDGSSLLASTYIGGAANDGIQVDFDALTKNYGDQLRGDVITDDLNNIYVCCNTRSTNFPVTAGAFQIINSGGKDACVFKLSNDMTTLLWSTYLGGTGEDAAYSIQVDSLYNVYVSGGTSSFNFPVTTGAYQTIYNGNVDAFVSHISSDGQLLLHSTFAGTTSYDQAYFVQLDEGQSVYLLGQTMGAYPLIGTGIYKNTNAGQFIHAFTSELDSTLFSTVIGSGGFQPNISPTAFLVNECGNIFISGWGGALNSSSVGFVGGTTFGMPVTSDAYRGVSDGSDFYIMVLSDSAKTLLYATYFGMNDPGTPDHVDGGTSRFDRKGIIYEAVCGGCGNNDNFPTTPGAWSRTNNSFNCNNAAFKFDLTHLEALFTANRGDSCGRATVLLTNLSAGGKTFFWDFGDGQTSTLPNPVNHVYTAPGHYNITLIVTDLTTCIGKDTSVVPLFVPPIPPITFDVVNVSTCYGTSVQLGATYNPTYTYTWTPAATLNSGSVANPIASPTVTTTYHAVVEDTNQCKVTKDVTVTVLPLPAIEAGPDKLICPGKSTELTAEGSGTFQWETSPYLSCSVCKTTNVSPPSVFDDYFSVEITDANGCKKIDSARVRTRPFPTITVSLNWLGRCKGETVLFIPEVKYDDKTCPVEGTFTWTFGDGSTSTEIKPIHVYNAAGQYPISVQYAYSNTARDTVVMFSEDSCLKNVFIPNTFTPNGDGNNDKVFLRTINATKILLRIYNRWGEEVFKTESLHEGWDGTYKGVKQTPQTFVYTADVTFWDNTRKVIEGNITLVE